jgi:hypothetical protein
MTQAICDIFRQWITFWVVGLALGDLTLNFSAHEFRCRCGCGLASMDAEFISKLQEVRSYYGKPMIITSGFRCLKHNTNLKGAPASIHMLGLAADIACHNHPDRYRLLEIAFMLKFTGIEVCDRHIHLDMRKLADGAPRVCIWGKSKPSLKVAT